MKYILILFISLLLVNCSLNKDSQYWTKDEHKMKNNQKRLSNIIKKAADITTLSAEEYVIYVDDYTKKSKYPDISK